MHGINLVIFIIAVNFVGFIAFAVIMAKRVKNISEKKIDPHWQWLIDTLGIAVVGGEPMYPDKKLLAWIRKPMRMEGSYRNYSLKIYNYTVGSGKNSTTYSTARIFGENSKDLTFEFHREGMFSKLGKMFGMQDIETGDTKFDKMFVVKSSDPDFMQVALLPEIKEKFYNVWEQHKAHGTIRLKGDELCYDEVGTISNKQIRERFAATADLLADLRGTIEFYNRKN